MHPIFSEKATKPILPETYNGSHDYSSFAVVVDTLESFDWKIKSVGEMNKEFIHAKIREHGWADVSQFKHAFMKFMKFKFANLKKSNYGFYSHIVAMMPRRYNGDVKVIIEYYTHNTNEIQSVLAFLD